MKIKLFQTDRIWQEIGEEILDLTDSSHLKGQAQNGDLTKELEDNLCQLFDKKFCITVASCTDALDITFKSLNLAPGSKIGVSNYTFIASAHAIKRAGFEVVPIEVDEKYCIDFAKISNVDAILTVDLFGNISNYKELKKLNIPIIVDAAQSFESIGNNNKRSPQYGLASCVSFSPSKTISSWGSGGAILTDSIDIAHKARKLRLHGKDKNDTFSIGPGLNSMMSSFECAAVLTGIKHMNKWRDRRSSISNYFIKNVNFGTGIDTTIPVHTFSKLVFQSKERKKIVDSLNFKGIETAIHYNTLINDEMIYMLDKKFPISQKLKEISFTIPNQHTLTDYEVEYILKALQ
jgi:dTDP-4-amino-4,6-dideoxygalactose transaminase